MSSHLILAGLSVNQRAQSPCAFLVSTVAASQTDVDLSLSPGGVVGEWIFPISGQLIGFARDMGVTAITAGTLTVIGVKNTLSTFSTQVLSADIRSAHYFSAPAAFSAGEGLGFRYTTNGAYVGSALLRIYPLVTYD